MEKNKLIQYIKLNNSIREIANKEGVSYSTIKYWLNKFDLKTNWFPKKNIKTCDNCKKNSQEGAI